MKTKGKRMNMLLAGLLVCIFLAWLGVSLAQHFSVDFIAPIPPAPAGTVRVACVGDSTTYGMMLWGRAWNCYPAQLQACLGSSYAVRNFGANSTTVLRTGDHPYTAHRVYALSGEFAPDIVLIMLGANDTKPENWTDRAAFAADYTALVERYLALSSRPRVILLSPPALPVSPGKAPYGMQPDKLDAVVAVTKAVAQEKGLPYVDIYGLTQGQPQYFARIDRVHLNRKGAALVAENACACIMEQADQAG